MARFEQKIKLASSKNGEMVVKMVDRITPDDVVVHLVNREIYRLITGEDSGSEVDPLFKSFLLKERFTAG